MVLLFNIFTGVLVLTGTYALVSLGFVYIFRSTGLINFAHGELLLVGAWIAYSINNTGRLPGALTILMAAGITGVATGVVYRLAVQPVETYGLFVGVIATMGVAAMLDGLAPIVWGTAPQALNLAPSGSLPLHAGVSITWRDALAILLSFALYAAVVILDTRSLLGVRLRAAASSRLLAANLGIRVGGAFVLAWTIAGALAGAAGIVYASSNLLSSDIVALGLAGMPAALIGGFDSLRGTLPGSFVVAIIVVLVSTFWTALAALAVTYFVLLIVIMVRPQGLYGSKSIERV